MMPKNNSAPSGIEIHPVPPEISAPAAGTSLATDHILSSLDAKQPANAIANAPTTSNPLNETVNPDGSNYEADLENPAHKRSKFRLTLIITALFLSLFTAALDVTIVATATPVITHELKSATGYSWIGGAYLIAQAIAAPIWAKLSDIWGRKTMMLSAVALFFVTSAICATAQTMRTLIGGRAAQGVAGGGIMLLVHIVISDLFSMRQRSLVMGLTEGIWATAGGVGPPLGGIFAELASWRWCFYINLPICGVAFVLLLYLDVKHEKTSFKVGIRAIDWIGIFCFLAFTLMVLLGLDFGGAIYPWDSAKVLCLIIIGTGMLGAFIYSQAKLAKYPLIPLGVFRDRSNVAALAVTAFHGFIFTPGEWYLPLYFQSCKGQSPMKSGLLMIPPIVATAVCGILTGVIIHRTGRFRELIWAGAALMCLGNGLFIMLDADTSIGAIVGLTLIWGAGVGMLFQPPLIALQSRIKQSDVATATSTLTFGRAIATSVAIIVAGVVLQNSMDSQSERLRSANLSEDIIEALSGREAAANVALANSLTNPTQQILVRDVFAYSLRSVWYMCTACAVLGIVAAAFIGKAKLSREHVETVTGIKTEKDRNTENMAMT